MGGRDHSCEICGRGGLNDPDGECVCALGEPAKKDAGLADGYCGSCARVVMPIGVEYSCDHPEHYDGVSEWRCPRCSRREGRWTGAVLTLGATEPRLGAEREEAIAEEDYRETKSI